MRSGAKASQRPSVHFDPRLHAWPAAELTVLDGGGDVDGRVLIGRCAVWPDWWL